jgi:hypothetical protein
MFPNISVGTIIHKTGDRTRVRRKNPGIRVINVHGEKDCNETIVPHF